jgi:hypothetical protein
MQRCKSRESITLGISGRSLTRPFRDACRFPSTLFTIVARSHMYDASVSYGFVHGPFSVAPCQTLSVAIRNLFIAVRECVPQSYIS